MKVIFSGTGSGTGIGVGIGRDVVKVLCLFFAAGHFAKAEQMNVLTQLHVANRQNVSMFTLGYLHPCESMLCVWTCYFGHCTHMLSISSSRSMITYYRFFSSICL